MLPLKDIFARFEREAVHGVVDTGRYRCRYYTWGEGPPLLLIPGLANNSRSFVLLASLLARSYRCIAYDPPLGRNDGARLRRYTHADLVADVWALLDHLGVERSYVFGSSFGSTVALAALHSRPERLPRGILQGGFAYRPLAPAEVWLARLARYLPGSMRHLPRRDRILRRGHYAPFAARPAEVWEYFVNHTGEFPLAAVGSYALLLHQVDLRPDLPNIRQPVLLVCGERDPLVSKGCEDVLLRGLPNALRVELSACGHMPLFTHPEVLADVMNRFLTPPCPPAACAVCEDPS